MARPKTDPLKRLMARVVRRRDGSECWEWTGARDPSGHGRIRVDGKSPLVHRLAYELLVGPIPEGKLICHHCDNPPCVNPAHLYAGTHADNARDAEERGQARHPKGSEHGRTQLTEDDVRQIRQRHAEGDTGASLAREYGLSKSAMSELLRGKTWSHV